MRRGVSVGRLLALAACAALLHGCGGKGRSHSSPPPPTGPVISFADDFSGPFPDPHWDILAGDPFTTSTEGNGAPALMLNPAGDPILIRSDFVFGADEAFTVSFDVASFEVQASSRFRFNIVWFDGLTIDASFDLRPFDDELVVTILDSEEVFLFPPSTAFDFVEFSVDVHGIATWWVNGSAVLSRSGFPVDLYEINIETVGGDFTTIVVDNVVLTRP